MKKFIVMSYVSTAQVADFTKKFEDADYAVEIDPADDYIVINPDSKGVYSSKESEGSRIYDVAEVEEILASAETVEAAEPVETVVTATGKHVVMSFVTSGEVDEAKKLLSEAGYEISGNESAPFVNIYPETKRATFATIAVGERLWSLGAVYDFAGISLPAVEESFDDATIDFADEAEVEAEVEVEETEETEEDFADLIPEIVFAVPAPKTKKTKAIAQGKDFALTIETDGELAISVDADEASASVQ